MPGEEDKKTAGKDLAATKGGALVTHNYGEDAGAGFENQTSADVSIPFLAVLQAMSPQCEGEDAKYRPGQLFNTVSEEAIKGSEGILFVPGTTKHVFVEWRPRDAGGGIVNVYEPTDPVVVKAQNEATEFGKLKVGSNDLIETFYVYGVHVDEDKETVLGPLVLAFTSTKIKKYKAWNSRLNMFAHKKAGLPAKPPLFAHLTRVTSVNDENTKGKFHNFQLAPATGEVATSLLAPDSEPLAAARQVREMVLSGAAQADYKSAGKTSGGGADDASASQGGDPDKAPF